MTLALDGVFTIGSVTDLTRASECRSGR